MGTPTINELTETTFTEEVSQPGVQVVDFWAPWCGPCHAMAPQLERAASLRPQYRFAKVNVEFTSAGKKERVLAVADAAACDPAAGGWYYDVNPSTGGKPTKIMICPATCSRFQSSQQGAVQIALGCQTQVR